MPCELVSVVYRTDLGINAVMVNGMNVTGTAASNLHDKRRFHAERSGR
jgi:hypothetical protein